MPEKPLTANTQDLAETEYDAERGARVGTEERSFPPISPEAPSKPARDPAQEERDAGKQAGQKRLGEDGLPSV